MKHQKDEAKATGASGTSGAPGPPSSAAAVDDWISSSIKAELVYGNRKVETHEAETGGGGGSINKQEGADVHGT